MDYDFLLNAAGEPAHHPRQQLLYGNLRAAIVSGRLAANHRLPGSRDLAGQLGIARNSVVYAYEQLGAEGYLCCSRRGTSVAAVPAVTVKARRGMGYLAVSRRGRALSARERTASDGLPFTPGVPALDAFPLEEWNRSVKQALGRIRRTELGYGDPGGNAALRAAISDRLRAARSLQCTPEQVVITDGTQSSLDLLAHALADVGDTVWMESPGYLGARAAFTAAGLAVQFLNVDDSGINLDRTDRLPAPRLVYVTPSHQYPLGAVLSLQRRIQLIDVARRFGALILEDDYDSDFRFSGQPLPALQGLIEDAPVIYLGTFSKSMFPGLRLGYFVAPSAGINALKSIGASFVRHGRPAEQSALASFMNEGRYVRHLNRMRKLYAERRQALRGALAKYLPHSQVRGADAGLHLVLDLPAGTDDIEAVRRARLRGLNPSPLSVYFGERRSLLSGLVLGYGNMAVEDIDRHVRHLREACHCA